VPAAVLCRRLRRQVWEAKFDFVFNYPFIRYQALLYFWVFFWCNHFINCFYKNNYMSSESVDKAYATQIANIEKSTGKKLKEWITIVNKSGFSKHGELVTFLKTKHAFTHGNANMLVHYAKQTHAGAAENSDDLITEQYRGKENLKSWYNKIMAAINKFGNDIEISPKKAYVSVRRKKQFAILQPSTKDRLDVGLNIKGIAPSGIVEDGSKWNAMCTHRIKVENEKTINKDLIDWIKKAYEQA
jgi:predicted transport protein